VAFCAAPFTHWRRKLPVKTPIYEWEIYIPGSNIITYLRTSVDEIQHIVVVRNGVVQRFDKSGFREDILLIGGNENIYQSSGNARDIVRINEWEKMGSLPTKPTKRCYDIVQRKTAVK
jgi:hypothetical protein